MAYISKDTLLAVYKKLSTLSADPSTQGATQKVSTIRYFLALDMFYRQFGRGCNAKDKNDAAAYIENVGKVVSVNGSLYTSNFFYPLNDNPDYAVGSNFYSVNVVRESTTNGGEKLVFPRRGGNPVMSVQSGILYEDDELTKNIEIYISSADYHTALIIWLLRNKEIDATNFYISALTALKSMFTNNFIDIFMPAEIDFNAYCKSIGISFSQTISEISAEDINTIFNQKSVLSKLDHTPLQKIWFGTPGSGKSHKIKEELKGVASENIFRITFHPDSDYSSFVGAYKPTMEKRVDKIYTIDELIDKLSEIKDSSVTYPSQKFAVKYWRSLKQLNKAEKRVILQSCNMQDSLLTEFDKGIALGEEYLSDSAESRIIYSFISQAFINAYIRAYQTSDSVYLIIEEINRGNCAQIFGDLFQLLDRGADGMSEYPIKADKDLCKYLESDEALGAGHPGIAGGNLRLPANLHIYATMNTSDQSLFPMDSAFKRRWDWEYVPIDLKCPESQFRITIGNTVYSWPSFLEKVNERIHTLSDSEDKQMGNFFIKTDVGVEEFKSKVMFYLWSEVCKEYEKSGSFFKNKRNGDAEFTFNSLFPTNAETNSILQGFMEYLGVETDSVSQPSGQPDTDSESHTEA